MESLIIRQIRLDDTPELLKLKLALDDETSFMMFEPGERPTDTGETIRELQDVLASENSTILVADAGTELAGYVEARGGEFRRNRHTAIVIAGVRQAYAGQGMGSQLFAALVDWADLNGLARLELTVMADNAPAIGLYKKFGFEIEGTRRAAMFVDGRFRDEHYMARVRLDAFAERTANK